MPLGMPLNIEAVYKQLSGYYDTLRKSRALDARNKVTVDIIQFYSLIFLKMNSIKMKIIFMNLLLEH